VPKHDDEGEACDWPVPHVDILCSGGQGKRHATGQFHTWTFCVQGARVRGMRLASSTRGHSVFGWSG
jgi:hypothetical protein